MKPIFAAVPVKDLREAKSRLGGVLPAEKRAALTLRTLRRVLGALRGAEIGLVCVVSPDEGVLGVAGEEGAHPLHQRSAGLNPALEEARAWALSGGASSLLVLPSDLPLLQPDDVGVLLRSAGRAPVVIAPDRARTGTNALLLRPPDAMPFAFGEGSFARHIRLARGRGLPVEVCERPNLSFDLDTAADLERLVS
ncbi:MAG: 2-phospho-L-lactate guanylyltransferase [Rubrobacteraceae bacterium]|nr:2-phospho-L-lactate guanylyltransferase [Rubrobacteraceae bacterium]